MCDKQWRFGLIPEQIIYYMKQWNCQRRKIKNLTEFIPISKCKCNQACYYLWYGMKLQCLLKKIKVILQSVPCDQVLKMTLWLMKYQLANISIAVSLQKTRTRIICTNLFGNAIASLPMLLKSFQPIMFLYITYTITGQASFCFLSKTIF